MAATRATNAEWRRRAEDDPFTAVAARPREYGGWTPEEFYAVGASAWVDYERQWLQYEPELSGTCVEIGCGAGRITQSLVRRFDRVIATDVSPRMLELARDAAETAEFHLVDDLEIPAPSSSVDAVFTSHVLQHLENLAAVETYFREAGRVLRPGGTMMAHVQIAGRRRSLPRRIWADIKLRLLRLRRAKRGAYCRVRQYAPEDVRSTLEAIGFVDVELREFRVAATHGLHAFWLARAVAPDGPSRAA